MSTENEQVAQRVFSEMWGEGNIAVIDELFAPDVIDNNPAAPGLPSGLQGVRATVSTFRGAFPDLHMTVEDVIAEGDKVVVRWSSTGTHKSPLMNIPPSGKTVHVYGIEIMRFAGGKIVERWGNFDMLGLLQQIGAAPAPGR